jgi:hypothetical protein
MSFNSSITFFCDIKAFFCFANQTVMIGIQVLKQLFNLIAVMLFKF